MTDGKPQTAEEVLTGFYQVAVGLWGIQPSEFWDMTPCEWWWLHSLKSKQAAGADILGREEVDDLQAFAAETHAKDKAIR